ncbi:MAG: diaminopimelate decarboxylase [Pseudomonadota bacterium]
MHYFDYKGSTLHAEGISIAELADDVGTPFYCYSNKTLTRHYTVFSEAFTGTDTLICYAIKANSNLAVVKTLADLGAGMDVVSEGELRRALAAKVNPKKIVFAGVGKTHDEMAYALKHGISSFNVESEPELFALNEVAQSLNVTARVALRINPDVDPKTHEKISTGKAENKFGIPFEAARDLYHRANNLNRLDVNGIHMHIGSQITDLSPFQDAFLLMRSLTLMLREDGFNITHLDLGGGLGVPYEDNREDPPHPNEYAQIVKNTVGDLDCQLMFEPGRLIAANSGILVAKVIYVKRGANKTFTIVDAAMNDLIRPTLYSAYHEILPVDKRLSETPHSITDVVGPICETGDYLAQNRLLPSFKSGNLIAVMTAGAYGAVQSDTYNSRLLVPEVMVADSAYSIIRPRQTYDDLLALDNLAQWQKN